MISMIACATPSSPRSTGADDVLRQARERDAEHEREEDDRQDLAIRCGRDGVARHYVDERIDAEAGVLGLCDAVRGLGRVLGEQLCADGRIQAGAGLDNVGEQQSERHGKRRRDQEESECLAADAAELAHVAEAGNAERERREHERHDHHEQHAEEDLADGLRDVGDDGVDPRRVAGEQVGTDTGDRAQYQSEQDLRVERHSATHSRLSHELVSA
jgi:hypothetical protein